MVWFIEPVEIIAFRCIGVLIGISLIPQLDQEQKGPRT